MWKKADADSRKLEPRQVRDVDACLNEDGWYHVQHEQRAAEGVDHEKLCDERVKRAREEYEVKIGWTESESDVDVDEHERESELEQDEEGEQSDGSEWEWEDEIRTPTVSASESLEDKEAASLGSKVSAIGLDGLII